MSSWKWLPVKCTKFVLMWGKAGKKKKVFSSKLCPQWSLVNIVYWWELSPSPSLSERCCRRWPGSCGSLQDIGRWHRKTANVRRGAPIKPALSIRWWLHAGSPSHPLPETGHAGSVAHRGQCRLGSLSEITYPKVSTFSIMFVDYQSTRPY